MKKYHLDENYYLREVKLTDASDLFKICSKENVTKYLTWNIHKNIDETIYVIESFYLTKTKSGLPNNYVIVETKTDKVIGVIDFMKGIRGPEVEIGYFLDDIYWGLGIVTKALNKLLEIGFNELNLDIIKIYHEIDNVGSMKVIKKNKFKEVGILKTHVPLRNKTIELIEYELKKDDYNDK